LFQENYKLRKNIIKSINSTTLRKVLFRKTNKNYFDFIVSIKPSLVLDKNYIKNKSIFLANNNKKTIINHKVVSVIKLNETSDVYCLEAVGPNGEHDRHNFPVCGKDVNGLHSRASGVFLSNCKYGDNFVLLDIDDKLGILGARQMPNFEMERHEGELLSAIAGRNRLDSNISGGNTGSRKDKITFHWRGKNIDFRSWQITHFRLLGDDRKLPYGTSILEKARRIWKQLLLSEDAMLIYRVTRAPERRVYKVFVGNIDDEDVEPYVNQIVNRFKRSPVIDPQTGQIDLRYNQLAQDQDYFIPVRDENAANPIDILPGASNLSEIADIEYLQAKLFTALRVPKSFLGFEDATGDGKNLALQDIRFSRTVNRIQQSMLRGLNEMAILHLYMLGFDDDIDNFTLTLNNPSTQAEMLKIEHLQQKITAYKDATSDAGNGFAPMSMTRGKREILGFSDDEIRQDLLEQRMEKAAAAEMEKTSQIIKRTGFFDKVDKLYGEPGAEYTEEGGEGDSGGEGGSGGGGGFGGGGGIGGDDLDFGGDELGDEELGDAGGEAGGAEDESGDLASQLDSLGGEEAGAEPESTEPTKAEEVFLRKADRLLNERKEFLGRALAIKKGLYKTNYMDKLIDSIKPTDSAKIIGTKTWGKNLNINEDIKKMVDDVDNILKD